jgi:hypothetical protein
VKSGGGEKVILVFIGGGGKAIFPRRLGEIRRRWKGKFSLSSLLAATESQFCRHSLDEIRRRWKGNFSL